MKIKITSILLAISMILSLFTVYAFASEAPIETYGEKYTALKLHYKNSYGDEVDDIGSHPALSNGNESSYEIKTESGGNKYGYYIFNDTDKNVFMQHELSQSNNIGPDQLGYLIFEFDFNDFGKSLTTQKFLEINSGTGSFGAGRVAASNILNVANDDNGNYFYFCNDKNNKIYIQSNSWIHVRCEMSVLSASAGKYTFRSYIGDEYFETQFTLGTPNYISQIRLGSTNSQNQIFGLDNVLLYSTPENVKYSDLGNVKGTIAMKIGAENAILDGTQIELDNVPMLISGKIYCPVDILEEFTESKCPDEYKVMLDGAEYIYIDDINAAFEVSAKSYQMGLILIGNEKYFIGDNASYEDITDIMKNFVFNIPDPDKLIADVNDHTNGFDHPYLLADEDKFTELRNIYNSSTTQNEEVTRLQEYIRKYLDTAKTHLNTYCGISETGVYNGIKTDRIPVNTNYSNYSNNGYDNGGRVSINTTPLLYFAFAYQMTGNLNYARAAYDFMLALGDWNHWGPDHFLNCADTAAPFAIAYDWLYDAFVELNAKAEISKYDGEIYDKTKLSTILFTHVIIPGYVQSNNLTCPWPGSAGSRYSTKTSNWNAVCASGVIAAALMLLEENIPTAGMTFNTQKKNSATSFTQTVTKIENIGNSNIHVGLNTYSDYAAKLTSMNLGTLAKYGLEQYAPDGSYVESPGYWSYGTNSLFRLIATLLSSTGDDYGFMDAWGIDTTCYFAIHSESSDYKTWSFNDGGVGMQDSSFFFFVGNYYEDDNLVKVRKKHLTEGKGYSLYDILYYDTTIVGEPELAVEYHMVGIDAFSVRSSWDKGAIYAGIIGGPNTVSHGQMDAGSFIYHNKGKIWFHDIGADNYNIKYTNSKGASRGYFSNYELYRIGAEGHNIITVTSEQSTLPYGQSPSADPKIIKTSSSEYGGYAVLDMSDAYGSHVLSAQRGLLFTNSRNTVVIQDEYVFNGPKTAYWFGHYQVATGYVDEVLLSADGRTAFMKSGDEMIRVSIVSDDENLKFEIMDAYTYLLDATLRSDRNTMDGATTEKNRDSIYKLAIKCENVTNLNLAVVIEEVIGYEIGSSYTYTSISNWGIDSSNKPVIEDKIKAEFEKDGYTVGSYGLESNTDNYSVKLYEGTSNSYFGIISGSDVSINSGASLKLYNKKNSAIKLADNEYVCIDFDVFTESKFISGTKFGLNCKDTSGNACFVSLLQFTDNAIAVNGLNINISKAFKHITILIDAESGIVSVYADDTFVTDSVKIDCLTIQSFEFLLPESPTVSSSILLDNINVRTFSHEYDATALENVLALKTALSNWNDRIKYTVISNPLAMANGSYLYTNADIENAIKNGYNVTLLRDTTGRINVPNKVTVETSGYSFDYISDSYFATVTADTIHFSAGKVTVNWHIGDQVVYEVYSGSSIATFKGTSDKIGKISHERIYYADGGTGYKFYTTGWSNKKNGTPLSDKDMIVSADNCDFWLVNSLPLDCLFVTIDSSNNVVPYYNESDLRTQLKSNTVKTIVLCADVEIKNTSSIALATAGKTVYLNGHKLVNNQTDIHVFTYSSSAKDNFTFVGPGTIEGNKTRTIFTSSSSTSDVTSNYGIVVQYANLVTNGQLADLRVGQHKFINCNLKQVGASKPLFALWNKNGTITNGVLANLLTVTFNGCTILSDIPSNIALFSYSAESYSEIYVNDTDIITNAILIESGNPGVKFEVSGNSSVKMMQPFKNSNLTYHMVTFGSGTKTNYELRFNFLSSGAVLTNSYDNSLPYLVSDNYAKVTWKTAENIDILTEYVSVGITPKPIATEIKNYLNGDGSGYVYTLEAIESAGEITLTPVRKTAANIMQSMSLNEDLSLHVYFEKSYMDSSVQYIKINNVRLMMDAYELKEINGLTYYKYNIASFTPANACNEIKIVIMLSNGEERIITTSAVDYLENLLNLSEDDNEKVLAVKILKYMKSAHEYFAPSNLSDVKKINGIVEKYRSYDLIFANLKDEYSETSALKSSIKSVCFNLSATVKIRFYISVGFTGTLQIEFAGNSSTYDIIDGKVSGRDYIEILMPANRINDSIVIGDGINSVQYSLNAYSTSFNNTDAKINQLLMSLSDYSAAAKQYIENNL